MKTGDTHYSILCFALNLWCMSYSTLHSSNTDMQPALISEDRGITLLDVKKVIASAQSTVERIDNYLAQFNEPTLTQRVSDIHSMLNHGNTALREEVRKWFNGLKSDTDQVYNNAIDTLVDALMNLKARTA